MKKENDNVVSITKKVSNINTKAIENKIKDANILIFDNVCAVALKYDREIKPAPYLVYKSKKVKNCKIAAAKINLPVSKHRIASEIAYTMNKNDVIPSSMFVPVAELLADIKNDVEQDFDNLLDDTVFYNNYKSKLNVEIGSDLIKIIDKIKERIEKTRKNTISELGLILPPIRIRDNSLLPKNEYRIKINNNEVGRGIININKFLLITNEKRKDLNIKEPVFEIPAKWITQKEKEKLKSSEKDYIAEPESVIPTHVQEIIKKYAGELLTRRNVYQIFDKLDAQLDNDYVYDIKRDVSIGKIQAVLTNLLKEHVPIYDIEKILETISIYNKRNTNIDELTEQVRLAISRTICEINLTKERKLFAITIDHKIENIISKGIDSDGKNLTLKPEFTKKLLDNIYTEIEKAISSTHNEPIILCSSPIRIAFKRLIERTYPTITVMSYNEICSNIKTTKVGKVTI